MRQTHSAPPKSGPLVDNEMVMISGRQISLGSAKPDAYLADGESPIRPVRVSSFWLDRFAVSNHAFEEFVKRADYLTDAERYGWSYVFAG